MYIRLIAISLLGLVWLTACSQNATVVPRGAGDSNVRVFDPGQCLIDLPPGVNAYTEASEDAIPVGDAMAGQTDMARVALLENGALFYMDRGAGLWFRLDGFDYSTEGDCAPPQ